MATQNTNLPNNISEYPNSFKRQTSQPLEMYEVFYNLDELKNYAQNSQLAYVGQYLKYSNSTTGVVKTYCIQNANGDLVEIPDKNYVDDAISAGGGSIVIDSELSDTSTHAVQNKVIKQAIDLKQDQLTFDDTPTTDSINPVTSKGIKNYVDDAISAGGGSIVIDSELSDTSTHAVQNKVIKQAIDLKADQVELERLNYYEDKDIIPSDESYFTVDSIGNVLIGLTDVGETQTEIVIPYKINGVEITSIGGSAFSYNQSLTSVIIPNSVTSIELGAFDNCTSLISIDIPNSVTNIGTGAFYNCTSLISIDIPNSVTSIDSGAFDNCTSLTSINIPNSVTSIGEGAFYNCTSLTSINIPNSVTSIGDGAFNGCKSLTSINIPNSVTTIGGYPFASCISLTSINIPNSVTSIGPDAFSNCTSLTSINIPNSVISIWEGAFNGCTSLTSINIPNSVTSIGPDAFNGCTNLTIYCEQGSYAETYANTNNIPVMYTDISATDFNNKADKSTTLAGYGITDAYTKTEVDTKDSALKDDMSDLKQKSIPNTTASGYPLTITDHLEGKTVINYQVYGNSTQVTRSGKNILPYPYVNTTKTISGITFTDNGDGTITVSGTATANTYFNLTSLTEYNSGNYYLSGCPTGGSTSTYLLSAQNRDYSDYTLYKTDIGSGVQISLSDSDTLKFQIRIMNGTTVNNLIFKPQLEVGTTATEYEQYGVMPSPDYPSEIQSVGDLVTDETSEYYGKYDIPMIIRGKNLCTSSQAFYSDLSDYEYMNTTLDDRNCIRFVDCVNVRNSPIEFEENTQYTVQFYCKVVLKGTSINTEPDNVFTFFYTDGTSSKININAIQRDKWIKKTLTSTAEKTIKYIGISTTNYVCYCYIDMDTFQLEKGSFATEYEPYSGETKHIYLDKPLRKVGDYADYMDFENQKVVRQIKEFTLTNTNVALSRENDTYKSGYIVNSNFNIKTLGTIASSAILCNRLPFLYDSQTTLKKSSIGFGGNTQLLYVCVPKEQFENVDALLEGAKCYMPLTIPTEEPITVPELTTPNSAVMNVLIETATQPSNIDLTYYQDINKKLDEIHEDISSTNTEIENIHTNYVKFTDYATSSKAGVVKYTNSLGIAVNSEGYIYTLAANEDQINLRQSSRYSIVPSNLDYAVSKSTHQDMSEDYDTSTLTVSTSFEGNQGKLPVAYDAVKNFIDDLKYKSIPHTTVRDYPISIFDYLGGENAINYQIYGNSTQATRSGKNLLIYPYVETTKTENGITFTDNGDGTITVNGTATADVEFKCCRADRTTILMSANQSYVFSGCPKNGGDDTYYMYCDALHGGKYISLQSGNDIGSGFSVNCSVGTVPNFFIIIKSGTTVNNLIFKPQLEIGETATSYEQYGVMPSPDYPSEIQSVGNLVTDETSEYYGKYDIPMIIRGKNLIKYPYQYTTRDINGIRFTDNGDGSVTINGTATANAIWFMYLNKTNLIDGLSAGDKITLSSKSDKKWSSSKMSINCNYFNQSGTEKDGGLKLYSDSHSSTNTITDEWKGMEIYIVVLKGQTIDNITISPQLEKGSSATEYEPYKDKIIKHIYLDEPLRKVGDYADYIDFKNQKVVRKIKEVAFDGTEAWTYRDTDNLIYLSIQNLASSLYCYSTYFVSEALKDTINPYFRPVTNILRLYQQSDNILYSSVDEFKTFLANQNTAGNPLIVDYILTTPTEESITVPELSVQISGSMNISINTVIKPSQIDFTYYQDINKVITNLTNAILAQGGNV